MLLSYIKGAPGDLHYPRVISEKWGARNQLKLPRHEKLIEVFADIAYGCPAHQGTPAHQVRGTRVAATQTAQPLTPFRKTYVSTTRVPDETPSGLQNPASTRWGRGTIPWTLSPWITPSLQKARLGTQPLPDTVVDLLLGKRCSTDLTTNHTIADGQPLVGPHHAPGLRGGRPDWLRF